MKSIYWKNSIDIQFKQKALISIFLIFLSVIFFLTLGSLFERIDQKLYGGLITLELLLFLWVNKFKILNISTFFVFFLFIYILSAPIIYQLSGVEISSNLLVINFGFLFYILGIYIYYIFHKKKNTEFIYRRSRNNTNNSKLILALALYFLALISSIYYFRVNRGVLSGNLEAGRVDAMSGNGLILLLIKTFCISVPMLYSQFENGKIKKIWFILLFSFSVVLSFVIGYKSYSFSIVIVVVFMSLWYHKINLGNLIFIAFLCLMIVLCLDFIRSTSSNEGFSFIARIRNYLTVGFSNYERVIYWFPKNTDFQYGRTILINFEMLLPGPDVDFTTWLKNTLQMDFSGGGVTPTIFGEFYINFSYLGIYFGFFAVGYFSIVFSAMYKKKGNMWYTCWICWQFIHSISGGISNVLVDTLLLLFVGGAIEFLSNHIYIKLK